MEDIRYRLDRFVDELWIRNRPLPVPADYNGDGRDELTVYRNGGWWNEGSGRTNFGLPTDKPVPADYDGDGKPIAQVQPIAAA